MKESENRSKEFIKYINCRIELFTSFVSNNPVYPYQIYNEALFREEFTFDNWLKGKIGKRLYKSGLRKITNKPVIFGKEYYCKSNNDLQEGFEYSIYRGVPYNFKRVVNNY